MAHQPHHRERPARTGTGAGSSSDIERLVDDLRAPLTIISAYAQLLQRGCRQGRELDPAMMVNHLGVVARAAERIEARLRVAERDARRPTGSSRMSDGR